MRHHRDPRRRRSTLELRRFPTESLDSNGDPIPAGSSELVWRGRGAVQPWLPRYNIPTAPITGGVPERRIAARAYLPPEAPVADGLRVYDVKNKRYYSIISSNLEMAGTGNIWRLDLGAPRILDA